MQDMRLCRLVAHGFHAIISSESRTNGKSFSQRPRRVIMLSKSAATETNSLTSTALKKSMLRANCLVQSEQHQTLVHKGVLSGLLLAFSRGNHHGVAHLKHSVPACTSWWYWRACVNPAPAPFPLPREMQYQQNLAESWTCLAKYGTMLQV